MNVSQQRWASNRPLDGQWPTCTPLVCEGSAVLRWTAVCLLALLAPATSQGLAAAPGASHPPNIVLIVADDLGFNQIGCYGETPIETPNLDRLAASGVRFTQAYAGGPVCSPSRVSLFTGRDARLMSDCSNQTRLAPSDVTLPLVLKHAGYDTALFGKYSIGESFGANGPMATGFDTWMGMFLIIEGHRQYPPFLWRDNHRVRIAANEGGRRGEYAQERFTDEAIRYIKLPHDNPFFVVLAYSSPHAELAAPAEYVRRYESRLPKSPYLGMSAESGRDRYAPYYPDPVDHPHATLAGMVTALDDYIGRVVETLAEQGVLENTLLLVTSDNGPHEEGGADPEFFRAAAPYRGIKRDVYDGGIHVPMIAHWPAAITRGRVDDTPWAFADVLPTLADVAGVPLASVARVRTNGVSIRGLLRDDPIEMSERTLYWEFAAQMGDPNSGVTAAVWQAARRGPWKAVRLGSDQPVELYNLADDPGESRNVSDGNESIAAEFEALFDKHL